MRRQGILISEIDGAFDLIEKNKYINLEGICSHFADSDGADSTFTKIQIEKWNNIVKKCREKFKNIKYIHISNTYGHKYSNKIESNVSRLGIGLYGLADIEGLRLKPVLKMKTIITGIKNIRAGESVGYNNTFIASKNMTIATIPVGYFEALDRRLSNEGYLKIHDKFVRIIGKISMNITTIDISDIKDVSIGDEVVVISNTKSDKNSIQSISEYTTTIPYEHVIYLPAHLKRIVVD